MPEMVAWWRPWARRLREAGYAGLSWPREYGGGGASIMQQAIFYEECDSAGAPDRIDATGTGFVGPTLIEYGTDRQKQRYLAPILNGDELWCQLFSEPSAGSDLAALKSRAVPEGDGWRIHGQKVWTSRAQVSEHAILLARTADGGRHDGISFFLISMRQPGVDVRPLKQMLGVAHFNEVFLDGAYVDRDGLVGPLNGGWRVAMSTLSHERVSIATGRVNTLRLVDDLIALIRNGCNARGQPLADDAVVRQKLAELYGRVKMQRLTAQRILSDLAERGTLGPEGSTAKLYSTALVEDICDFALSLLGVAGQQEPNDAPPEIARWLEIAYQARGTSIAGGSTFIQRNILAERVLQMPRSEVRQ
jgi:alkylation response protein AidB-like acyl-CoA dehydrogenase